MKLPGIVNVNVKQKVDFILNNQGFDLPVEAFCIMFMGACAPSGYKLQPNNHHKVI